MNESDLIAAWFYMSMGRAFCVVIRANNESHGCPSEGCCETCCNDLPLESEGSCTWSQRMRNQERASSSHRCSVRQSTPREKEDGC